MFKVTKPLFLYRHGKAVALSLIAVAALILVTIPLNKYYLSPDKARESYYYISIEKTNRLISEEYVERIEKEKALLVRKGARDFDKNDAIIAIFIVIWLIFGLYFVIVNLTFSRAHKRSVAVHERALAIKETARMVAEFSKSSQTSFNDIDTPFTGTVTSIDELGMGVVRFGWGSDIATAVFTPEVTWYLKKPDWLRPGRKVQGRLHPTQTGFRITFIEQGGAA